LSGGLSGVRDCSGWSPPLHGEYQ